MTLIERVAQAIQQGAYVCDDDALHKANAVLAEIREPDSSQLFEGALHGGSRAKVREIYQAMLGFGK